MAEQKELSPIGALRFGVFQVNLAARELRKHGVRVRLPGQPFCILYMLLEKPGEIVTREEMRQRLWASNTFVDFEHSLNSAIKKLRAALGDSPENSRYIETVPRVGYRFIAPTELLEKPAAGESVPASAAQTVESLPAQKAVAPASTLVALASTRQWLAVVAACLLVGGVLGYGFLSTGPTPRVTSFLEGTFSDHVDGFARLVTDGTRVYFLERHGDRDDLVQTSTAGGETHVVDAPFRNTRIFDISPDHSRFLIGSFVTRRSRLPLWIWPVQGGSPVRVGDVIANDAAWCPTVQNILYCRDRDIHIVKPDGTSDRILIQTPGYPRGIRWSPDASRFTFSVEDPQTEAKTLWEAFADGSNAHVKFPGWSDPPSECCGEWTPDGRYFVFTSAHEGFGNLWAVREKRSFLHWRIPEPVRLTPAARPLAGSVLTRNGTRAFANGWNVHFDFVRYDASSRRFLPSLPPRETLWMSFSKDGAWMVSMSVDRRLWRSKADGSERVQLTAPPLRASQPQWSPDGNRIAFEASLPGKPVRAYVVSAEGGTAQEFFTQDGEQSVPSWSPDGNEIAVALNVDAPQGSGVQRGIYLVNWQTREARKVPGSEGLTSPMWSPNGKYFIAKTADEQKILLFDAQAKKWGQIAEGTALSGVTWSGDSRYLFMQNIADPGQPVYRLHVGDFKKEGVVSFESQIEGGVEECVFEGLGPDGSLIVRLRHSGSHVYALDLDWP